jgi:hypothetical protein
LPDELKTHYVADEARMEGGESAKVTKEFLQTVQLPGLPTVDFVHDANV